MKQRGLIVAAGLLWLAAIALMVVGGGPDGTEPTASSADEELWQRATVLFKPLPEAAENEANPITAAKVELGKTLYFDPQLSKDGNISCNSCHNLATFGVDRLPLSPGDTGALGGRNSPTVFNAALHVAQFWDGRADDVEQQAGMPILNPVEMAIPSEDFLVGRLAGIPGYPERFAAAFPDDEPALSYVNVRNALAAFERTLLTPSRFDDYLRGDRQALSEAEKDGLRTFMGSGCTSCHNGVNVGGHIFRKFGLNESYWVHTHSAKIDPGRFDVTGDELDKYVFKVSALRNVAQTGPYFHDGSVPTLDEAIRVMVRLQVGIELENQEVANVVAFLDSLTGQVPKSALASPLPVAGK